MHKTLKCIANKISKPEVILKTFYMTFFFKVVECVDAICVIQLLYYETMVWILSSKLWSFCGNKLYLYSCNIVEMFIEHVLQGWWIVGLLSNQNDVIFSWIIYTRYRGTWCLIRRSCILFFSMNIIYTMKKWKILTIINYI